MAEDSCPNHSRPRAECMAALLGLLAEQADLPGGSQVAARAPQVRGAERTRMERLARQRLVDVLEARVEQVAPLRVVTIYGGEWYPDPEGDRRFWDGFNAHNERAWRPTGG